MAVAVMSQEPAEALSFAGRPTAEALRGLAAADEASASFTVLDISLLEGEVGEELLAQAVHLTRQAGQFGRPIHLRLGHVDLGSGADCEQRVFDLKAERELRTTEKAVHVGKKSESAKQKDFAVAAQMRRDATAGMEAAEKRLEEISAELQELETRLSTSPWFLLFSQLKDQPVNYISHLDLRNCGLHATSLELLQKVLLELEHRGDGHPVEELILDGNDLGDAGTVALAALLRLTSHLKVLRLRNIGITDGGFSQILSASVANKTVSLLDLRGNGLCTLENGKVAVQGLRRFNQLVQILVE